MNKFKILDELQHYKKIVAELENEPRPISKRIEPKVEKCGELITYTWEEE